MKNFKIIILLSLVICLSLLSVKSVFADTIIDDGLSFLKSKQDATGRINTGFSAPSQWSAIAFAANGIDITTIKNPSVSLRDFLIGNLPSEPSAATDWETRILAIVATGDDPTNYGGVNYVTKLEGFFNKGQIGDICSLNDDIFGLLAEISAGPSANIQIKQTVLSYLISNQDKDDGGFGYSTPGCAYYATSADMTGAAIQALVAAKNNGLTDSNLDSAIEKAKNYILKNQDADGGYGYYGSSDADTTGWVLMAYNALNMKDSTQSAATKNWLISQQSGKDGGFLAFDYGVNALVTNATTTAQAIIGLSGKSWILKIFSPAAVTTTPTPSVTGAITGTITPSPTIAQTITPTVTPTPVVITQNIIVVVTATPTETPIPTPTEEILAKNEVDSITISPTEIPTQKITGVVLGAKTENIKDAKSIVPQIFTTLGVLTLALYGFLKLYFFLNI